MIRVNFLGREVFPSSTERSEAMDEDTKRHIVISIVLFVLGYALSVTSILITDNTIRQIVEKFGLSLIPAGISYGVLKYFTGEVKSEIGISKKSEHLAAKIDIDKLFSALSNINLVKNIEEYVIKHVYRNMPRDNINEAIKTAKNVEIRFLVFSYALIWNHHFEPFKEALANGCIIEVITAHIENNCFIKYCEETDLYKENREYEWAKACVISLNKIKHELPLADKDKFTFSTYTSTTPIAAIEIGPSKETPRYIWFGILWSHSQSYDGPWFEIQGDNRLATYIHDHINEIKRREPAPIVDRLINSI